MTPMTNDSLSNGTRSTLVSYFCSATWAHRMKICYNHNLRWCLWSLPLSFPHLMEMIELLNKSVSQEVFVDMAERRIRLHWDNSRPQTPTNLNMIERIIWKRSQIWEEQSSLSNFQEETQDNLEQHTEEDETSTDNFQQGDPKEGSTDLKHDSEEVTNL